MQDIRSSNPPVVTGICDPNKSQARPHRSTKYRTIKSVLWQLITSPLFIVALILHSDLRCGDHYRLFSADVKIKEILRKNTLHK